MNDEGGSRRWAGINPHRAPMRKTHQLPLAPRPLRT
jgi:hypothetical protein